MIHGLINRSANLLIRDIFDLFRAPVQERFELLGDRRTILRRRNLLGWNGSDANFFVGANLPAQELLNGGLHDLGSSLAF
jgi:hypothetical protein